MYGDTSVVRRRVGELREQAADLRAMATHLIGQAEQLDWTGRAADSMRARLHDRVAHLHHAAERHDQAAEALDRHAACCDQNRDAIAAVERRAGSLIDEARARADGLAADTSLDGIRREPSAVDRALLAFTPPTPGHVDWLTAEIPGA